jgi:HEAT repeat protein
MVVVFVLAPCQAARSAEDPLDSPMYRDPEVRPARVVKTYPDGLRELWLAALQRPGADLPSQAAQAIAAAHAGGMPGLAAAAGPLTAALDRPDAHPVVRLAAAKALVALGARAAAPSLLKHARDGDAEFRAAVEPALARWDYPPARDVWLDRLGRPESSGRSLLLAVQGLAAVREEKAAPRLRGLVLSPDTPAGVRLEAARGLAVIRPAGSESDAKALAADPSPRGLAARLAAASLLARHEGEDAIGLLRGFARDTEPAVAAIAVARLAELDPRLLLAVLDPVLASPDAGVRAAGVAALAKEPSAARVGRLGDLLADPHPDVRAAARRALGGLAGRADLREPVIARGMAALAAADWRGQEQAALLLARLGHKPAAGRLVALLTASRPEVFVAAARGLRVLAAADTLPAVLAHVRDRHQDLLRDGRPYRQQGPTAAAVDEHLAQLVQLLGRAGYRPADATLRRLVPRYSRAGVPGQAAQAPALSPVGGEARAAAVWALGRLHEGKPAADLVGLIEGRLTGDPGMGLDDERVRRMAAVALGRMKAAAALPALEAHALGDRPTTDVVANACRWAAAHLAGRPPPPDPGVVEVIQRDWFLVPLK